MQRIGYSAAGRRMGAASNFSRHADAAVRKARRLVARGWTCAFAAEMVGASRSQVSRWVSDKSRCAPARWGSSDVVAEVRRLVASGCTQLAAAQRVGFSQAAVSRWVNGK